MLRCAVRQLSQTRTALALTGSRCNASNRITWTTHQRSLSSSNAAISAGASAPTVLPSSSSPSSNVYRSHLCSNLSNSSASGAVTLSGWLQSSRVLGERWFGVLRDHTGSVQLTWSRSDAANAGHRLQYENLSRISVESIVQISGRILDRPDGQSNSAQASGNIEVQLDSIQVLNACNMTLPFSLESSTSLPAEELRLKHRFLDLRRPWMQKVLRLRAAIATAVRESLNGDGFIEVETPLLFKSTPEGADEFLVPTRHQGRFYALPQSPQQHKQLLMIGGIDRYYQIARCFRDEGSRADRQPEFTQIDLEMSFVRQNDVMGVIERMMKRIIQTSDKHVANTLQSNSPDSTTAVSFPLQRISYAHAMNEFGVDKPDRRYGYQLRDVTELTRSVLATKETACSVFESVLLNPDASIKALRIPKLQSLMSRKEFDSFQKEIGQNVLLVRCNKENGKLKVNNQFQSLFSHATFEHDFTKALALEKEDVALVCASTSFAKTCDLLGKARIHAAHVLVDKNQLQISSRNVHMFWVVDFPLFDLTMPEVTSSTDSATPSPLTLASLQLTAMHHPFTAPVEEDAAKLDSIISQLQSSCKELGLPSIRDVPLTTEQVTLIRSIRGAHYDLVANGVELGGGSIRIHQPELQRSILQMLGAPLEVFQHLLSALTSGAPPHGGIALGLDRVVGLFGASLQEQLQQQAATTTSKGSNKSSAASPSYGLSLPIREVIAFPKSSSGQDLMVDAPSAVPAASLLQYHIQTVTVDNMKEKK